MSAAHIAETSSCTTDPVTPVVIVAAATPALWRKPPRRPFTDFPLPFDLPAFELRTLLVSVPMVLLNTGLAPCSRFHLCESVLKLSRVQSQFAIERHCSSIVGDGIGIESSVRFAFLHHSTLLGIVGCRSRHNSSAGIESITSTSRDCWNSSRSSYIPSSSAVASSTTHASV